MQIIMLSAILIYQIVVAILDLKDMKKYKNMEITEKIRVHYYKETVLYGWLPTIFVLLFIVFTPLKLYDIGIRGIVLGGNTWLNIITFVLSGIALAILVIQSITCLTNKKYQKQILEELESKSDGENHYDVVIHKLMIPRTKKEKRWFFGVSLTAGICEEIIWRGTLIYLLQGIFPKLNILLIGLIICVIFGVIHMYQGIYGIIKTAIIAVLFVMLYIATGSLFPGIVLHFLFDFSTAFLIQGDAIEVE